MTIETLLEACHILCHHKLGAPIVSALIMCNERPVSMKEISDACGFTSAATTGTCDVLDGKKWAVRNHGTDDRRVVMLEITAEGRKALKEICK